MDEPKKNIIFDWNCTLLDDIQPMFECTNIIMSRVGREPVTMEFFQTHCQFPLENMYRALGFPEHELEGMVDLDKDVFREHYDPAADAAGLRHGAPEVLAHARAHDIRMLILSNHIVGPIRAQLRRLEIEHMFDEVLAYASREIQFKDMTKGERLRRHMEGSDIHPQLTIIVGDSVEEIEIAHARELISVAITGGVASEDRLRAARPHYLIHSLHDLKPILRERGFAS